MRQMLRMRKRALITGFYEFSDQKGGCSVVMMGEVDQVISGNCCRLGYVGPFPIPNIPESLLIWTKHPLCRFASAL